MTNMRHSALRGKQLQEGERFDMAGYARHALVPEDAPSLPAVVEAWSPSASQVLTLRAYARRTQQGAVRLLEPWPRKARRRTGKVTTAAMQIPGAAAILQQSCLQWTEQKPPVSKHSLACLACFDILRPQGQRPHLEGFFFVASVRRVEIISTT